MFGCDPKKNQYLLYSVVETFVSKQRSEKVGMQFCMAGACKNTAMTNRLKKLSFTLGLIVEHTGMNAPIILFPRI
jgi:hypothetical protein